MEGKLSGLKVHESKAENRMLEEDDLFVLALSEFRVQHNGYKVPAARAVCARVPTSRA